MQRRRWVLGAVGAGGLALLVRDALAAALSQADAAAGVRAALERGSVAAVGLLGKPDGFLGNPKVRIGLPGSLDGAAKMLKMAGQQGKIDADALLTTAEQGSAWSLLYPNYKVMIPEEPLGDDFVAYPLAKGNPDFARYLDTWLMMAKTGNKAEAEYNYWILGKDPKLEQPRWSVIRDVLHWVE